MKSKSTHRGHCQACGRLQMLPNGRLSKHGYNIDRGYFSGTCVGSGELPFEVSIALILTFIDSATQAKASVLCDIEELTNGALTAETKMWARIYVPAELHWSKSSRYVWQEVSLSAQYQPYDHDKSSGRVVYAFTDSYERTHGDPRRGFNGVQRYDTDSSDDVEACRLATVRRNNVERANWLQHEVTSLARYIAWQNDRIKNWAQSPLLHVDAKSKLGFVPEKAPY